MITILDYYAGNIGSVRNALGRLGAEYTVSADPGMIRRSDRLIIPGVGSADKAVASLRETGLAEVIHSLTIPVLGICVGMQVMCQGSEEGGAEGLGIFAPKVRKFIPGPGIKIPHTGWDTIYDLRSPLFTGSDENTYVYYVHSYCPEICTDTIATTCYGDQFSGALGRDNFYGTQFHPEKSGAAGERILRNFMNL